MAKKHAPRGPIKATSEKVQAAMVQASHGTKCSAHSSQTGLPCRRWAIKGGNVCIMHGGSAPHVKQAAKERLMQLQGKAIDALDWLVTQRDFPSATYAASRDILDRTEGKPAESVRLDHSGEMVIRHEVPE